MRQDKINLLRVALTCVHTVNKVMLCQTIEAQLSYLEVVKKFISLCQL